ncbi:PREDICTED: probable serine/threonine-protein kinase fhkE [Papilio xuthus]|uniref:Probable serine/threonine-protein kinase fhkE n=1 Tax=Papilio xuthus TaxID=66420 RepID=A0AAJ7EHH7_PAPXU|nr:PREDICTED: probable serine/threonine-protein kinase fhkE [Papilio xuthus]
MFYILQTIYLAPLIYSLDANRNFYIDSLRKYEYEDISQNKDTIYSSTVPPLTAVSVDKVSRRHYEIVNVLWRKTKIFLDVDALTTSQVIPASDPSLTSILYTSNQCINQSSGTTPSGIEFYYLDKIEELRKQKDISNQLTDQGKDLKVENKQQNNAGDKLKSRIIRRPIFALHLNNKNIKEDNVDSANFYLNLNKNYKNLDSNETNQLRSLMNNSAMLSNKRIARNNNNDSQWFSIFFNDPLNKLIRTSTNTTVLTTESTTIYDRIKFFEMYDKNTEPSTKIVEDFLPNVIAVSSNNNCENKTQIVNNDLESQNMYVLNSIHNPAPFLKEPGILLKKIQTILNGTYKTKTNEKLSLNVNEQNEISTSSAVCKRTPNVWSKFPYIAAYIYEPLSIYCDAAAINSYWLIAAGSCLARHHKRNMVTERSAYISYCSDKWWETESVAYVRRSLIHPSYSYRDRTRRHHYNIGTITSF